MKAKKLKITLPDLNTGEIYAGLIINDTGPDHHLILLPGQANNLDWKKAVAWAKKVGGELPTRREQSLLFANLKEEFEPRWYWSAELYEPDSGYAWAQDFDYGYQGYGYLSASLRARAVRRVPV